MNTLFHIAFLWCLYYITAASPLQIFSCPSWALPDDTAQWSPITQGNISPIRLYAARNETESVLLVFRNAGDAALSIQIQTHNFAPEIPPPKTSLVQPVEVPQPSLRSLAGISQIPDLLVPTDAVSLSAQTEAWLWVSVYVPSHARPGVYPSTLDFTERGGNTIRIPLRLEVFAFILPQIPTLPTLGIFSAEGYLSLQSPSHDLVRVASLANMLARSRVSAAPWSEHCDEPGDVGSLWNRVGQAYNFAVLEQGGHALRHALHCDVTSQPAPARDDVSQKAESQDSQASRGADKAGASRRWWTLIREPDVSVVRAHLPQVLLHRNTTQERNPRLCVSPLDFVLERYVDAWALPIDQLSPDLQNRFKGGYSLRDYPTFDEGKVTTSAFNAQGLSMDSSRNAAAVFDGCLFTYFALPKTDAETGAPPFLEFAWDTPQWIRAIRIIWYRACAAETVQIETAFEGGPLQSTQTSWEYRPAYFFYDNAVTEGKIKYPAAVARVRLNMARPVSPQGIRISEVAFDRGNGFPEPQPMPNATIQPWLRPTSDFFPSLAVGTHPLEQRLVPWVCFGRGIEGIYLGKIIQNLEGKQRAAFDDLPLIWFHEGNFFGSLRLERLRDGLEDYEYLNRAQQQGGAAAAGQKNFVHFLRAETPGPNARLADLKAFETAFSSFRVWLGRNLSNLGR